MTTPQKENRELTDDEMKVIREVYIRRAGYVRWLVLAVVKGLAAALVLGVATSGVFGAMFFANPMFWVGLVWGASVTAGLDAQPLGASIVKTVLTAPMAFQAELVRRRGVVRADQAMLVEKMKAEQQLEAES